MTVHNFSDSLQVGEQYEQLLDAHFGQWFEVEPVTMALQRLGIDRIFTKEVVAENDSLPGRFTVEYKTDLRAHETGNAYIETVSVKQDGEIKKLGWLHTSTAQILMYYIPGLSQIYIIDVMAMRDQWRKWNKIHRTATADNGDYVGEGLLVPVEKLRRLARGIQKVEDGHISGPDNEPRPESRQQDILRELGY